jgi:LemA protein
MIIPLAVFFAVLAMFAFGVMAIYNRLVALRRNCDQAASDIDVQLRQRHDLIPNLVEVVKGYASHERGTLEDVMRARAAATSAPAGAAQERAEATLTGAIGRLMAVAEAYPDLKASTNFSSLQEELSDIENKIAASRRFLNATVNEYNVSCEQFPANFLAKTFGFGSRDGAVISQEERPQMEVAPVVHF